MIGQSTFNDIIHLMFNCSCLHGFCFNAYTTCTYFVYYFVHLFCPLLSYTSPFALMIVPRMTILLGGYLSLPSGVLLGDRKDVCSYHPAVPRVSLLVDLTQAGVTPKKTSEILCFMHSWNKVMMMKNVIMRLQIRFNVCIYRGHRCWIWPNLQASAAEDI